MANPTVEVRILSTRIVWVYRNYDSRLSFALPDDFTCSDSTAYKYSETKQDTTSCYP